MRYDSGYFGATALIVFKVVMNVFWNIHSYEELIHTVVASKGDADTIASARGPLSALCYGVDSIDKDLFKQIDRVHASENQRRKLKL